MKINVTPQTFAELEHELGEAGLLATMAGIDETEERCLMLSPDVLIRRDPQRIAQLGQPVKLTRVGSSMFQAVVEGKGPPIAVRSLNVGVSDVYGASCRLSLGWANENVATVLDLGSVCVNSGDIVTVADIAASLNFRIG